MIVTNKTNILEKVDEKMLLISILGSLEAIKNQAVTIDEVEKFIISAIKPRSFSFEVLSPISPT